MTLIARLRILLNDVDPQPMRHIDVPLKIRLDRLYEVVQAAMRWTDIVASRLLLALDTYHPCASKKP